MENQWSFTGRLLIYDTTEILLCIHGIKFGLIPQEAIVKTHPLPILKLPGAVLFPEPFIPGSRTLSERVANKVISTCGAKNTAHQEEWINWRDNLAPQSEDADAYVAEKGLWLPFKDILFQNHDADVAASPDNTVVPRPCNAQTGGRGIRVVETTSAIVHGGQRKSANVPPRRLVRYADGTAANGEGVTSGVFSTKRRRGRQPAAQAAPPPAIVARGPTRGPRQRLEEVAYDSDDDVDETEDYTYSPLLSEAPNERVEHFWYHIGRRLSYLDNNTRFKVLGVCTSDDHDELFYAYYDIDTYGAGPPADTRLWEYTPCREMLDDENGWVKWDEVRSTNDGTQLLTETSVAESSVPRRRPAYEYVPRD